MCFYKRLSTRPELLSLLQEYAGGKDFLTRQDFELFLRLEQGEKQINGDIVKDLMERFEPVPENIKEGRLGIDGEYLCQSLLTWAVMQINGNLLTRGGAGPQNKGAAGLQPPIIFMLKLISYTKVSLTVPENSQKSSY